MKKRRVIEKVLYSSDCELATRSREYLQWMALKNYAADTIRHCHRVLDFFLNWCLEHRLFSVAQITHQEIKLFEKHLLLLEQENPPLSVGQRYHYLHTIQKMFSWLTQNGWLAANPAQAMVLPKIHRHSPGHMLTHNQIESILSQLNLETPFGLRNRALLETLYSTGIRRTELVGLNIEDVNWQAAVISVRHGKGNKQRIVPVGQRAVEWLGKYFFEIRPTLLKDRSEQALFLTYKGKRFTCSGLANVIAPLVRIVSNVGCCHIFRHSMATAMLDNGADIRSIQEILGHEELSSTQVYTHVATEKLREVYDKTHPQLPERAVECNTLAKPLLISGGQPFSKISGRKKNPEISGELAKLMEKYLTAMAADSLSVQTIAKRKQHLQRFARWCQLRAIDNAQEVTHGLIEHYHKDLFRQRKTDKPLTQAYLGRHLISIRCWFTWLSTKEFISHNPAKNIQLPRRTKTIPHYILSQQEIEKIFAQVDISDPLGVRDRAMLELLYATGIRRQELCSLNLADVNFAQKTLRIFHSKGNTERIIPVNNTSCHWLEFYLAKVRGNILQQNLLCPNPHNPLLQLDEQKALFLGRFGNRLSPITFSAIVKLYFKKAGIKKPGNCHLFRHTLATGMLENGADIRHIQQMLGHTNLSSTQIYTKVSIRKLKEIHTKTHPASELRRKNTCASELSQIEPVHS